TEEDLSEDYIEELKARRADKNSSVVDEDEAEAAEGFELPGADLSGEELSVRVVPRQADEFTCSQCFLVHHRSQLAYEKNGLPVCSECAACPARQYGSRQSPHTERWLPSAVREHRRNHLERHPRVQPGPQPAGGCPSAVASSVGRRVDNSQYGVGSAGSSRTTRTELSAQARCRR